MNGPEQPGASAMEVFTKEEKKYLRRFKFILVVAAVLLGAIFVFMEPKEREASPSETAKARELAYEQSLCRLRDACTKYDRVRLECATAGNFKTCLRIKMDKDIQYTDLCSGYNEGAPAVPLDPNTPNFVRCFVLNNF